MKYNEWFEESGTIDTNVFPTLGDGRTFVVIEGRVLGKTLWVKQYIENYEKAKQEKKKVKIYKVEKQPKDWNNKILLYRKGSNRTGR